ncbi:hypothetical protein ACFLYU_03770 [Candidatus Dependentiae bacterium]
MLKKKSLVSSLLVLLLVTQCATTANAYFWKPKPKKVLTQDRIIMLAGLASATIIALAFLGFTIITKKKDEDKPDSPPGPKTMVVRPPIINPKPFNYDKKMSQEEIEKARRKFNTPETNPLFYYDLKNHRNSQSYNQQNQDFQNQDSQNQDFQIKTEYKI